jgi:hypothetical protein
MLAIGTLLAGLVCLLPIARFARAADRAETAMPHAAAVQANPLSEAPRPNHGGDVRLAGPYWLELVANRSALTVYVTDRAGNAVDAAGGKGKAGLHTDGKATQVELRPAGGNRLEGKGRLSLKPTTVVFVTVDLRGQKPHRTVFRPLATSHAAGSR